MSVKIRQILALVIISIMLFSSLSFEVSALESVERPLTLQCVKNSDLYKDIGLSKDENLIKAIYPIFDDSDNSIIEPNFVSILGIDENSTTREIEDALISSKLIYKTIPSDVVIRSSYKATDEDLSMSRVYYQTPSYNHFTFSHVVDDGSEIVSDLINKMGMSANENLDGVVGYIILKDGVDNVAGDLTAELILRYYIYDSDANSVPQVGDGRNNVYVADYDLTEIIKNIPSEDASNTEAYPIVSDLYSVLGDYREVVIEKYQENQQKLFDTYTTNNGVISTIIDNYNKFITGNTTSFSDTDKDTVKYGIQTMHAYYAALKKSALFDKALDIQLPNNEIVDGSDATGAVDIVEAVSEANKVADKYYNGSIYYTNKNINSNAALFSDLIKYRYGIISGASERGIGSNASDQRVSLPNLDKLLIKFDDLNNNAINPLLFEQFIHMKKISYAIPIERYFDIFASLQYLEYYAVTGIKSGLSEVSGSITNEGIEKAIKANEGKADNEWEELSGDVAIEVKTYIQIKDGLEWLGIQPWTKELKYIYDVATNSLGKFPLSEDMNLYDTASDSEPLKRFFSVEDESLSSDYLTGIALSSTFVPMQTNMYDPTSIRVLKNEKWLSDFHIKYGFYRKALMIDNNVNAAVNSYVTQSKDTSRPAMLKDLLEYNKDIVLYVDDNFYNTDEVAEMTNKAYDRLANTEQASMGDESARSKFDTFFVNSIEHLLKTGPRVKYDESTIADVTEYGEESKWFDLTAIRESLFTNGIIMSSGDGSPTDANNDISIELNKKDYSVKQSYAVVSGIYRHTNLASLLNSQANSPKPVFVSSPTLFNIKDVPEYEFNSIYNYYMLRNLESSIGIDYRTTLDLENTIYIDIYGNILTESGLVIIPAASNATLYPEGSYSNYTLGFMDLYANGVNITTKNKDVASRLTSFNFEEEDKFYSLKNYSFNGVPVNAQRPSIADNTLLNVLYDNQVSILNKGGYIFNQRIWLITEVLRGAPIENINKTKEGLIGKRDVSKYGLYMSWKLDEVADMLLPTTNGNSIISMPNLAFMDGIEYVMLFLVKFVILLFVIYLLYMIYLDAIGGKLGIKTFVSCTSTLVIFILCIVAIPTVITMSYNEPNKIFLQDEIKYINLLNYEKSLEGREISAVGVTEPKSQTKLYLKVDSMTVPWYKVLQEVMLGSIDTKLEDIYEEELESNMLYGYSGIQVLNDGVYIDVNDIFDSSSVVYNNHQKFLYQNMNTPSTASYFIPYYFLMDNLLESINMYNIDNSINNISTKIQSDGSVKTMGMIGDYLLSEEFLMESIDPLNLYTLYGIETNENSTVLSSSYENYESSKNSMWYSKDLFSYEEISSNIEELYSYFRAYVAENREMIGRITDETFIKSMMLDVSIKYNKLFRLPVANSIEVFSIDSRDLIRLSITDKGTAVSNSSHSFGKFIYNQSGGLGVILTAILIGVFFISSIIKPGIVLLLCSICIYNILIKGMFDKDRSKTVEGLLYMLSSLVIINSVYAILLKLGMMLPNIGLNSTMCIIGQIAIQLVYLVFVYLIINTMFKDVANMGYNIFHSGALAVTGAISRSVTGISNKVSLSSQQQNYMRTAKYNNDNDYRADSSSLISEMRRRDNKRTKSDESEAFKKKKGSIEKDDIDNDGDDGFMNKIFDKK